MPYSEPFTIFRPQYSVGLRELLKGIEDILLGDFSASHFSEADAERAERIAKNIRTKLALSRQNASGREASKESARRKREAKQLVLCEVTP
jgi:hypothetical protein